MERYTSLVTSWIWLTDFIRDQCPAYFTTRPAHTVKIISIFNLINQSKSCQPIHIKVTLYKPLNSSCLHNFNRASVENKEYKISHASGFHVSEELVSTIICATNLIPVHSKLWLRKVPNNLLFTAESTLGLLKTKEMITNLKELLIFNYILLVSCMSEMYQEQYGGNTYWWKCVNGSLFFSLS